MIEETNVKTDEGLSKPRNEEAPNRMSEMHGNGISRNKSSVRRVRLSRMSTGNSDGISQEVSAINVPLVGRRIEDFSIEEKIAVLNAFNDLKEFRLALKVEPYVLDYINDLFSKWINERIQSLMNESKVVSRKETFTEAEINALKILAKTILNKPASPNKENKPLSPPKDAVKSGEWRKAQESFLSQLEQMDVSGPNF